MPTYEYECSSCKQTWEEDQRITDPPSTKCLKCSAETAKRLVSGGSAFVLAGEGWAKDGYGK